ncbi:DUF6954 family protein [Paenibacillus gansuensis]|uniref:DUF6954 family protein n=1 Tax=Paenibacillus gansuensis TaxID=306542 RepID=A0ABW5PB44_9BACL
MKAGLIGLFAVLFGLVTFFGLGPAVFADGSPTERWLTFLVVVILYLLLTASLRWLLKRFPG